jgi:ring-1,2-phenylacetyl-CoA epoxidase subunit PaaD
VRAAVGAVRDPELGDVTLDDLGLVRGVAVDPATGVVTVELVATFLGCPARGVIEADVAAAVASAAGIPAEPGAPGTTVSVRWLPEPWRTASVTAAGRERLAAIGVVVEGDPCPRCRGSLSIVLPNGSASCRSVARCDGCGDLLDVLRGPDSELRFLVPSKRTSRLRPAPTGERGSYAHL